MSKIIVGAGLAGLIAACAFKDAEVREAGPLVPQHKALLRFRDESVSALTGIPFRRVTVDKAIWSDGKLHSRADIRMANSYSLKVSSQLAARSIWNLDRVDRFIAPEDFHAQLCEKVGSRIIADAPVHSMGARGVESGAQFISTMPLPAALKACGMTVPDLTLTRAAIRVDRYRIPRCNVHQTIYFPDRWMLMFRASITGDMLIVESMDGDNGTSLAEEMRQAMLAFGLDEIYDYSQIEPLDSVEQQYGKIVELPRDVRESILYRLTHEHGVYSLGRFATWRNILLDDVAKDITFIQRLMQASEYGKKQLRAAR